MADPGCGYTVQTDVQLWMRDKLVEAIDIVPFGYADTLQGQAEARGKRGLRIRKGYSFPLPLDRTQQNPLLLKGSIVSYTGGTLSCPNPSPAGHS